MNYKLPSVTVLAAAVLAAYPIALAAQQTPPDGQQLVAQAAERLVAEGMLEVKLRQQVHVFGQQLVGSGRYWQQRDREKLLRRLELKVEVGGAMTSTTQVCDGRFMWMYRDFAGDINISRVDLRQLEEAQSASATAALSNTATQWFVLGGLPQLLDGLSKRFEFGRATPRQLGDQSVWVTEGRWRAAELARMLPDQSEAIRAGRAADLSKLPEHVPALVIMMLSRDDTLPLFPHRIEYHRHAADPGLEPTAIVALDLFEVRRPEKLDDRLFKFNPGDLEVADHTDLYLGSLGLKTVQ